MLKYMNLQKGSFPYTESICDEVLSLPMGPHLTTNEVKYIIIKIKEFYLDKG